MFATVLERRNVLRHSLVRCVSCCVSCCYAGIYVVFSLICCCCSCQVMIAVPRIANRIVAFMDGALLSTLSVVACASLDFLGMFVNSKFV